MPSPPEFKRRYGREPEEVGLQLVLNCTQALFRNRKTLTESCYDNTMTTCKKILRKTYASEQVRETLGAEPQHWRDIRDLLEFAIPTLDAQSLAAENPRTGISGSSSALMALNHETLMKDLERLNDILLIGSNMLASAQKAQNLAGENSVDQQVLKLVDLCVRVTARGFDGDSGGRTEIQWGNIIGLYKKLLITCLQFLYNFIQENEQRKLLLWLDLFANSKVQNDRSAFPLDLDRENYVAARLGGVSSIGQENCEAGNADESYLVSNTSDANPKVEGGLLEKDIEAHDPESYESTKQAINEITESVNALKQMSLKDVRKVPANNGSSLSHEALRNTTGTQIQEQLPHRSHDGAVQDEILVAAAKTERGDEFGMIRTPKSAAVTLQAAKDQLMARLADTAASIVNDGGPDLAAFPNDGEHDSQDPVPSDEEDGYRSPGEPSDRERGLLTDIPLVLGPQEIEALPMIIQIGICAGHGAFMQGKDMQGMRCNILLAGEAGRNLLRELLIFIAAWDLQDEEVYFKFMMQIMEAILENGLMPYAYQTFAEVKDIVSPAQSMVIKLLTQIFRGKQGSLPTTGKVAWTAGNVHADASRRVDIYIVRYIFTMFRQCIIPETCALIYLQGQIKAGHALPEDFPLNLWDMERVYEGVYQFLEFFAVLTESEEWKDLLVNWEIVSELVTLLRELEASIPKAPLGPVPHSLTEAQHTGVQPPRVSQPTNTMAGGSLAVERPFDMAQPVSSSERSFDVPPPAEPLLPAPSPLSQTDSQDPDALDAADPSDFEWRNLKKLVILVLSSLVWKSPTVQKQIRQYGGVEMVLACCTYDGNNPYIREHAVMCLRFLLEGSEENRELVRGLEKMNSRHGHEGSGILSREVTNQGQAQAGSQAGIVLEP